jgi:hypothetical protein
MKVDLDVSFWTHRDVAITWHEYWFQGLEDAANVYFTDKDADAMLAKLDELHEHWHSSLRDAGYVDDDTFGKTTVRVVSKDRAVVHVNAEPAPCTPFAETEFHHPLSATIITTLTTTVTTNSETATPEHLLANTSYLQEGDERFAAEHGCVSNLLLQVSFIHAYGRDLQEASEWVGVFKKTRDVASINQAWELYSSVFRRIKKQINNVESIELQHVSPKLLHARDFEVKRSLLISLLQYHEPSHHKVLLPFLCCRLFHCFFFPPSVRPFGWSPASPQLAVPGTYSHRCAPVRIAHFATTVKVRRPPPPPCRVCPHRS